MQCPQVDDASASFSHLLGNSSIGVMLCDLDGARLHFAKLLEFCTRKGG